MFPVEWDVLDGRETDPYKAKLNHYTRMPKQPYHPFPDRFAYPLWHPVMNCDWIWWENYLELRCEKARIPFRRPRKLGRVIVRALEMEADAGLNGFGRPAGYHYHFTDFDEFHREAARVNPLGYRYNVETYVARPRNIRHSEMFASLATSLRRVKQVSLTQAARFARAASHFGN
jgi:hypothetical protein